MNTFNFNARLASFSTGRNKINEQIEDKLAFVVESGQDEQVIKDILTTAYGFDDVKLEHLWDSEIDSFHSNIVTTTNKIKFDNQEIANCINLGSFVYKKKIDKEGNPRRTFKFEISKNPDKSDDYFRETYLDYKEDVMVNSPVNALAVVMGAQSMPSNKPKKMHKFFNMEIIFN